MKQIFCVICDAFNCQSGSLCHYCRKKVEDREVPYYVRTLPDGVKYYYLFRWDEEADLFCRRLVYFLKERRVKFFKEWTSLFPYKERYTEGVAAVVPTSSRRARFNHAAELAKAFPELFGLSCVIEIGGAQKGPQKLRNRAERLGTGKILPSVRLGGKWVFVDDVFVSGGTYNSVKTAMGNSPEAIYTLFYRPNVVWN